MKRKTIFAYGLICYGVFFATFLYAVGFIGNLVVPKSIDSVPTVATSTALFINTVLLAIFAVQHSVMARPAFKRLWTKVIPKPAERSTYVLMSSLALILLFALWEPMGGVIWNLESPLARGVLYGVYGLGWVLLLASSFAINHFDLFGLRQTWHYARGSDPAPLEFKQPLLYRIVRHPLYLGWFMIAWATPTMTITHLFFAAAITAYTLIGIQLEERDLIDAHPEYEEYKKTVPMIIPSLRRKARRNAATLEGAA